MTCLSDGNEELWTPKRVEARLEEAADTMRKLPRPRVAGYFNTWPETVRSYWDSYGWETDAPVRGFATPREVTRMEATMPWLRWLERDDQKIVWARANGRRWKAICTESGLKRSAANERWTYALSVIAMKLNNQPVPKNRSRRYVIDRMRDCGGRGQCVRWYDGVSAGHRNG